MPSRAVIDRIIDSGRIGAVTGINANLCYSMTHKATAETLLTLWHTR